MKKFGEKLRHRLESLDIDIVKLKGGFINAMEYDEVLNKLFDFT